MATNPQHLETNITAEEELGRELEIIESTVIKPIVRRKLHVTLFPNDTRERNQDALELVGDIRLSLLAEIQKGGIPGEGIRSISSYAATIAFNACHQHFRSRYPRRTQLRNKLRYLFNHDIALALWQDSSERWLCGLKAWSHDQHCTPPADADGVDLSRVGSTRESSVEIIKEYLGKCIGPVFFDDFVDRVAAARGLSEPFESKEDLDRISNIACDPKHRADTGLELAARLGALWAAVLELPPAHRKALLLNLRDNTGDNLLAALPLTGVATIREIASAIDMTFEELAEIWNSLPWDDNRIAEQLGVTRQQVINLRQTARSKLLRWRKSTDNI